MKKYVFDRSFDDSGRTVLEAPRPIPEAPKLPEKNYEDGFKEGFQRGIESQAQVREETVLKILEKVEETFTKILSEVDQQRTQISDVSVALVKSILEKVFPSFAQNLKLAEKDIESKIVPVIQEFREGRVKVFVHKNVAGFIESRLRSITRVPFDVIVDDQMAPGDCRLSWNESGFEFFRERLREEVCALLDDMVATGQ